MCSGRGCPKQPAKRSKPKKSILKAMTSEPGFARLHASPPRGLNENLLVYSHLMTRDTPATQARKVENLRVARLL